MNFMDAKLLKNGGEYAVEVLGHKVVIDGEKGEMLKANNAPAGDIVLGVRPEHMSVKFKKEENAIEGVIVVNEMMGSELHLHVNVGMNRNVILRIPTIDLTREQRSALESGNKLYFSFASKVVQIFDPQTEKSLLYK
jgi:multiple sugar transport system ATP-binding protein